ncbi:MAG: hypothetical protein RIF36_11460 [Imperialibacter sp.]|uniref:hypothetical protein n=1 Tax=Imperialibacter sp. TaxID=2038411 RepID=UPI0032EE86ED
MSIKEFDKRFGLRSSIEEEKTRFINRIENKIFDQLIKLDFDDYHKLFNSVCFQLGLNASEMIDQNSFMHTSIPNFDTLTKKDFIQTLRVLVAIHKAYEDEQAMQSTIDSLVKNAINSSALNIGIRWADGTFYPTGDELLDKELIDTAITLLDKFPDEKTDLKIALDNYQAKSLSGVVENCYLCIEGLGRKILNNKRTLDNNQTELLKLLQFSNYWDKIFLNYLKYAHEYRRHAGENRHKIKPEEVEAFLYLTCLIVRSTIKAFEQKA